MEIFEEIRSLVVERSPQIRDVAAFIGQLDCLTNLAEVAVQNRYTCPEINKSGRFSIEEGRHPVIEKMIPGERFVPNNIHMDNDDQQILVITGPNMAGKSTILRQTALLVLMAQIGAFVPAKKAVIGVVDRIFTRVGALDDLSRGQSTFMVEMQEAADILNNASAESLVIMDEIGMGTSTFDGLSIAWAVVEYLHDLKEKGVKTLFATHYHELTELSTQLPRVKNYHISVKEFREEIIFLRKLVEGGTNRSYGIQVARLAGIPAKVIRRAKSVLHHVESVKNDPKGAMDQVPEPDRGPVQLDLFDGPEKVVLEELRRLEIAAMTPMDAMNFLHGLQEKLASG